MRGATLFSGIGAPELSAPGIGWILRRIVEVNAILEEA